MTPHDHEAAQRDRLTGALGTVARILDNPDRRHEPDGVCSPALAELVAKITPENCHRAEHKSVLAEAEGLIHGARNSDYGHPLDNHTTTADLMSAYLSRKHGVAIKMDAEDVCLFNVLQKVSRLANTPGHRDSLVDIGGYVGCVEMIQDERKARAA
jgi:hypothetical protein